MTRYTVSPPPPKAHGRVYRACFVSRLLPLCPCSISHSSSNRPTHPHSTANLVSTNTKVLKQKDGSNFKEMLRHQSQPSLCWTSIFHNWSPIVLGLMTKRFSWINLQVYLRIRHKTKLKPTIGNHVQNPINNQSEAEWSNQCIHVYWKWGKNTVMLIFFFFPKLTNKKCANNYNSTQNIKKTKKGGEKTKNKNPPHKLGT